MRKLQFLLFALMTALLGGCETGLKYEMSLAGIWSFQPDSASMGEQQAWFSIQLNDHISLPGTMDNQKKGNLNTNHNETSNLSREYYYVGKAWYSKTVEIPTNWKDRNILLTLERTKPTKVWVDNDWVGASDDISTKQVYDLTDRMTPGTHKLTIMVDNGNAVPAAVMANSHAYVESTQTNWNGIIGDIKLEARPKVYITDLQIYPSIEKKNVEVKFALSSLPKQHQTLYVTLYANAINTEKRSVLKIQKEITLEENEVTVNLPLGDNYLTWSEYEPNLYKLLVRVSGEKINDEQTKVFGIRDFKVKGTQFAINGKTVFLRGKHDACVFPLTAHVAMDVKTWQHYFQIAKSYGINHYRFHSWCPPEACFEAADLEGVYLQPELPIWGSLNARDSVLTAFLLKEGEHIQRQYSNHASFVMFSLGNELSGDKEVMETLVNDFRKQDNRHLFSSGSNNFLGYQGYDTWDDFFTTCRIPGDNSRKTHTRGSFSFADADDGGYINATYPNTVMNFDSAVAHCAVPVISHETGQFQIYPDYDQIKKYTGNLKPWNLEVFKKRLEDAGMADQAKAFFEASGKWAVELYRADIEMDLRTKGMAGFQLLDLQDYPGQGSAYVGILDAFMDSKGLIEPKKFKEFCNQVVPMLITSNLTYYQNETMKAEVKIANYSTEEIKGKHLTWQLLSDSSVVDEGTLDVNIEQGGLFSIGDITPDISKVKAPKKTTLLLELDGTEYRNSYPIWVFETAHEVQVPDGIKVAHRLTNSLLLELKSGGKVLYFPDLDKYKEVTVGGLFQTDYWNYRMFKTISERVKRPESPGTMGILTNPAHPLFNSFPTDGYTNWQWYPMVKNSRPLILDQLKKGYKPIVQVIDNIERNHKLGLIFEFSVGKGKLLICMTDLENQEKYPEARQLYNSILTYMNSDVFNPTYQLTDEELDKLFTAPVKTKLMGKLDNISY